jgi:hypothetical protein
MYIRVVQAPVTRRMARDYLWTPLDNDYCLSSRPGVIRRFSQIVTPERFKRGSLAAPLIPHLPSLLIGRLSWARAIYSMEPTRYVAAHLRRAQDILSSVPVLDERLINQLVALMGMPDDSIYAGTYSSSQEVIQSFLEIFEGSYAIADTVSVIAQKQGVTCGHQTPDAA